ncbi:zinc ribbon domain-containing protein [Sporofaciens sp. JLR.KK001]|uniref:zinc ribbon domain-containing protein n=1 Tax=Sporofaciens sp. JLR.KK001 TaxID=3112621 RepID=UPI002FF2DFC7
MDRVCKTIHQYNREPIKEADMEKLQEIAEDYRKVKNYVYSRYGGIASLSKIYPGYTVQNEMTGSGYRETLGMPAVYFYLAIFDALGDIKSQWTRTKTKISKLINQNEGFTEEDKHYLRFLLKVSNAFEEVLNQKPVELPNTVQKQYIKVSSKVDAEKLNKYLCRQVRKHHVKLHTDRADGFAIAERAYRYADHGIYISIKEKRKRVFVLLTDNNQYKCQLRMKLYPQERRIEIKIPVNVSIHNHKEYRNEVGVAVGLYTMMTTDEGHRYGEELGKFQLEYSEWIRVQTDSYRRNKKDNPGRKKYYAKKRRMEERLHCYINQELNRLLREEKPKTIFIVKLPKPQAGGHNKKINYVVGQWQRGYIRKRLTQKCKEQSVEIVEVLGKDISNECSECGAIGMKAEGRFHCPACGYEMVEKVNTARNVKKRGKGDGALF